jgi:hypothetical protein
MSRATCLPGSAWRLYLASMAQDGLVEAPAIRPLALGQVMKDRRVRDLRWNMDGQRRAIALRVAAEGAQLGVDVIQLQRVIDLHSNDTVPGALHLLGDDEVAVDVLGFHDVADRELVGSEGDALDLVGAVRLSERPDRLNPLRLEAVEG